MIDDQLYALAFEYRKTKLWMKLWDVDVFAVKLSDGKIGYISIMGAAGTHCAIGLYIGETGLQSFRELAEADCFTAPPLQFQEIMVKQECLQCIFEPKDELTAGEQEEVKRYARAHGIRLNGKNAYPQFVKYQPYCYPWPLQDEQDQKYLMEAITAAIALSKLLEEKSPAQVGMEQLYEKTKTVVMLEWKNGDYTLEKIKFPEPLKIQYPEPRIVNEISLAKLKKEKRAGVWECEIVCCPYPIQDQPGQVPYFPFMLMAVEQESEYMLPILPIAHYGENLEELLNSFMDALLAHGIYPEEIWVRDERTYMFLKAFCKKLKIACRMETELEALDEAEYAFLEEFDIGELKKMEQDEDMPERSYVISVSLGTGCYRHIRISGNSTLEILHRAILDAFGFDDDHAHAFFMNNIVWSSQDCYFAPGIADGHQKTDEHRIDQVGLLKGMKFKYLFDFGEEWTFQCKVLRIEEGAAEEPVVIRSKGEAPVQYGDWNE